MKSKKYLYYRVFLVGLLTVVALVCFVSAHFHGFFKKIATGLQYQVVRRGRGPAPKEGDMLLVNVCYKTEKGDVLFNTVDQELPMVLSYSEDVVQEHGVFEEAVRMLQKGGSLVFKLSAEKIFGENSEYILAQYGLKKEGKILLHLQLQDIMTKEAYKKWEVDHIAMLQKKQQKKAEQQLAEDAKIITNHLKENKITPQITSSGLCYVVDTPGRGAQPEQGDRVKVNYTGRLIDGRVFDTSLAAVAKQHGIHNVERVYEPLEFQVGAGQVIRGWDEGMMHLRQGDKARFFIPSTLAYGSQSVGNGLIPANAILIFDVEFLDVES